MSTEQERKEMGMCLQAMEGPLVVGDHIGPEHHEELAISG
jgi:hypothetical protein